MPSWCHHNCDCLESSCVACVRTMIQASGWMQRRRKCGGYLKRKRQGRRTEGKREAQEDPLGETLVRSLHPCCRDMTENIYFDVCGLSPFTLSTRALCLNILTTESFYIHMFPGLQWLEGNKHTHDTVAAWQECDQMPFSFLVLSVAFFFSHFPNRLFVFTQARHKDTTWNFWRMLRALPAAQIAYWGTIIASPMSGSTLGDPPPPPPRKFSFASMFFGSHGFDFFFFDDSFVVKKKDAIEESSFTNYLLSACGVQCVEEVEAKI